MVRYCYIYNPSHPLSSHRSSEKPYQWVMLPWQPVLSLFSLEIWRKVKYWQAFKRTSKLYFIKYTNPWLYEFNRNVVTVDFAFQVDWKHNQTSSHSFFLLNCQFMCLHLLVVQFLWCFINKFNFSLIIRLSSQWFLLGSKWYQYQYLSPFFFSGWTI